MSSAGDMSPNSKLKAILDQSEVDMMKPVDSDTDKVKSTSTTSLPPAQMIQRTCPILVWGEGECLSASYVF